MDEPLDGQMSIWAGTVPAGTGTDTCLDCAQPFGEDDVVLEAMVLTGAGPVPGREHIECQALGIVGHSFGVCACHGFDRSRESALELWQRMAAAGRAAAVGGGCPSG